MELQDGKYLTFSLKKEEYGIPILKVKEIIGLMDITDVPKTPNFVKGVINLRGKIIPVMDLRLKFKMEEKDYDERTCTIVVEININNTKSLMGIVVDTVSEVVNISKNEIEPPPQYSNKEDEEFLIGMGKVKGKVVMLLNIERIINSEELVNLLSDMKGSAVNV
ncbi:MAG: chemotaxis protein CheW [Candidatus Gastranaerophilales bacterium]|nr:chemotaxis protein CheW [Candidatus Gastranaerophilales bacterium]